MHAVQHFVGIDIAAENFTAAIFIAPEQPPQSPPAFLNNATGFEAFHDWLRQAGVTPSSSVLCLEATGVYGEALCYWFAAKGYAVAVEPPNKVKRAFPRKGHKTDAVDSRQIAEYAYRYVDELRLWKPRQEIIEQISVLLATREQFVAQKTANRNALKALQRKVVQTPVANTAYQTQIRHLQEQIDALEKEIQQLINHDGHFQHMVHLLDSVPGVGLLLAANLLTVTNGFTNAFTVNARQLASHAGICPYQVQSGSSVYKRPRSPHHGPSRLRKLLHLAARSLRTHHAAFKRYFVQKLLEGKARKLIINNIANRLLKIICAIMKTQKPYRANFISVNPTFLKKA